MIVFLNGRFVPEQAAVVSVFDRSFLYGDGLFETMLVVNGVVFRWQEHLQRLEQGAAFLRIGVPFEPKQLKQFISTLIRENNMPDALLRLTLSRGVGVRGYSTQGANSPTLVMTLHPLEGSDLTVLTNWRLSTCSLKLPAKERLASFKTCNKLAQILARAQALEKGADEALLENTDGFVVEGATSNLFWIEHDTVCTPPLESGILLGVTRRVVLELCRELGVPTMERNISTGGLMEAEGVFLSLSSAGIVQAVSLDGQLLGKSAVTHHIHQNYLQVLRRETSKAVRPK